MKRCRITGVLLTGLLFATQLVNAQKNDSQLIQELIRDVYHWNEQHLPSFIPAIEDDAGNKYVGFNLAQLEKKSSEMDKCGLFTKQFIENYQRIYRTLHTQLQNNEIEWFVGEQEPFGNGADPWCNCQDVPFDEPNPWSLIEVEIVSLDSYAGELNWKWGGLEPNSDSGWNEFRYAFKVVKENDGWKIDYMEGFDLDEFTGVK